MKKLTLSTYAFVSVLLLVLPWLPLSVRASEPRHTWAETQRWPERTRLTCSVSDERSPSEQPRRERILVALLAADIQSGELSKCDAEAHWPLTRTHPPQVFADRERWRLECLRKRVEFASKLTDQVLSVLEGAPRP